MHQRRREYFSDIKCQGKMYYCANCIGIYSRAESRRRFTASSAGNRCATSVRRRATSHPTTTARTCSPCRATTARRSWSNSALSAVFSVFKLTQLVGRMSASGRVSVCNSPLSQQPFFAINRCSVCVRVCICVKRDVLLHSISIFVRQCFFYLPPRPLAHVSPCLLFYERAR